MKTVTEIAVTLENSPGSLSDVVELLGANGIGILGLTLTAEGKSGGLCFVAPEPERAANILRSSGYEPVVRPILAVSSPTHPGGLNTVLRSLKTAGVNIERLYGCSEPAAGGGTILLVAVDNISGASEALARDWITLYGQDLS